MQVYRMDKDYCYTALDELKRAVANCDRATVDDALDKLADYLGDLTKTVEIASKRFKKVSELIDDHLDKAESNHEDGGDNE
jgi:hypothetical protein